MAVKKESELSCIVCFSAYKSRDELLSHYLWEHKALLGSHKCDNCQYRTRSRTSLIKHYSTKHRAHGKVLSCSRCFYSTLHRICLDRHVSLYHRNDFVGLSCWKCIFQAPNRFMLAKHLVTGVHKSKRWRKHIDKHIVDEGDSLRCLQCGFQSRWRNWLVYHINTRHRSPKTQHSEGLEKVFVKEEPLSEEEQEVTSTQQDFDIGNIKREIKTESGEVSIKQEVDEDSCSPQSEWSKIRLDEKQNKFFCTECKYSSKRKSSIMAHVNLQHKHVIEKFKCTHCPYTTKVKGRLSKHLEKHTKKEITPGTRGRKGKRSSNKYNQFVKDEEGIYKCTECDYSTKWRSSIIAHMDNYHNPNAEEFKCQQCSYKTRVKAYLQQHRVTHRIATTTGKKLKRTPRKYKQIVRDSELNMYRCSECDYSTKWRSSIIAHVDNYHNPDAEVYSCPKCSYKCKVKSYLQQHLLTHERGNSTAGRRVTGSSKYKQLSYDGARDLFTCTDCDYTSKWRGSVIAHIGLRHNSDATVYRCPHCPYSSKVKSYFVQHSRTHDAKMFKCSICSFVTKNKRTLEHHSTKEHGGTLRGETPLPPMPGFDGSQYASSEAAYYPFKIEYGEDLWPSVTENEAPPDINSLEPSIESSPDLTLAIEMNLNEDGAQTGTCAPFATDSLNNMPPPDYYQTSEYQTLQSAVTCPYCLFSSYSKDEVLDHIFTYHQQPTQPNFNYYYSGQEQGQTGAQPIPLELL